MCLSSATPAIYNLVVGIVQLRENSNVNIRFDEFGLCNLFSVNFLFRCK